MARRVARCRVLRHYARRSTHASILPVGTACRVPPREPREPRARNAIPTRPISRTMRDPGSAAAPLPPRIEAPQDQDVAAITQLNNLFTPDGLTLERTERFVELHLEDYRVIRAPAGGIVACVALDAYAPSLVELISLAVAPDAQGRGLGRHLITAAEHLAQQRGYSELFAISLADQLFLSCGFEESTIARYPEKIARYRQISRSELALGRKFCFTRRMAL